MGAKRSYFSDHAETVSCYNVSTPTYSVPASNSLSKSSAPRADEGITVKGRKVNQDYAYGEVGALERSSQSIILHLKGQTSHRKKVARPRTVKIKLSCDVCGKKSKSSAKFCSSCGNYLD